MSKPKFVKIKELARIMQVEPATVYRLRKRTGVEPEGEYGKWYNVEQWLKMYFGEDLGQQKWIEYSQMEESVK